MRVGLMSRGSFCNRRTASCFFSSGIRGSLTIFLRAARVAAYRSTTFLRCPFRAIFDFLAMLGGVTQPTKAGESNRILVDRPPIVDYGADLERLLELRAVEAGYGGRPIPPPMSLSIGRSEIWALLWRNGSGKSTLLST